MNDDAALLYEEQSELAQKSSSKLVALEVSHVEMSPYLLVAVVESESHSSTAPDRVESSNEVARLEQLKSRRINRYPACALATRPVSRKKQIMCLPPLIKSVTCISTVFDMIFICFHILIYFSHNESIYHLMMTLKLHCNFQKPNLYL